MQAEGVNKQATNHQHKAEIIYSCSTLLELCSSCCIVYLYISMAASSSSLNSSSFSSSSSNVMSSYVLTDQRKKTPLTYQIIHLNISCAFNWYLQTMLGWIKICLLQFKLQRMTDLSYQQTAVGGPAPPLHPP